VVPPEADEPTRVPPELYTYRSKSLSLDAHVIWMLTPPEWRVQKFDGMSIVRAKWSHTRLPGSAGGHCSGSAVSAAR